MKFGHLEAERCPTLRGGKVTMVIHGMILQVDQRGIPPYRTYTLPETSTAPEHRQSQKGNSTVVFRASISGVNLLLVWGSYFTQLDKLVWKPHLGRVTTMVTSPMSWHRPLQVGHHCIGGGGVRLLQTVGWMISRVPKHGDCWCLETL